MININSVIVSVIVFLLFSFEANATSLKDVRCIALNIYHEARGETKSGMEAIAWVTLNRANHPSYPNEICNVVYQKSQFSWTSKKDKIPYERESWEKAIEIAEYVLDEQNNYDPTNGALFFHNKNIKPYWADRLRKTEKIGNHIFYR